MNSLNSVIGSETVYALGWTLVHSLWQSSLIALLVALSYSITKKSSANLRYWINAIALLSCVLISLVTFYIYIDSGASISSASELPAAITTIKAAQATNVFSLSDIIDQHINQLVLLWLIGFGLYIFKYLTDLLYCQHLKTHKNTQADDVLQKHFHELKICLGITKSLTLRISETTKIPCVIGHFKPVVLLPASVLLNLSSKQIEVILLHELGHISRNDYLVSNLQNLVRSIYFFNPFIHWMSSNMDEERENACDDIAVSVSGDPLFYANTLKEFTEMNSNNALATTITGRKNMLLNRIKRLFIRDISFTKTYGKTVAVITLFLLGTGFSVSGYSTEEKVTADDSFTIKLEKEPLSNFLKLAQEFCPNMSKNIQLKNGEKPISGDFPGTKCEWVEPMIKGLDDSLSKTLTGIGIHEEKISLKELTQKIEITCPDLKGKILLNNPDKTVGFHTDNVSCTNIEKILETMDKNESANIIKQLEINDIKFAKGTEDTYAKAIEFNFPKDAIEKQYSAVCTAIYSVDTKGKAFDILPVCTNGTPEAQEFLEKYMKIAIEKAQFPIKAENNQNVVVKNKEVKVQWRFTSTGQPTTAKTISK